MFTLVEHIEYITNGLCNYSLYVVQLTIHLIFEMKKIIDLLSSVHICMPLVSVSISQSLILPYTS